jgi:hypothetical protein
MPLEFARAVASPRGSMRACKALNKQPQGKISARTQLELTCKQGQVKTARQNLMQRFWRFSFSNSHLMTERKMALWKPAIYLWRISTP